MDVVGERFGGSEGTGHGCEVGGCAWVDEEDLCIEGGELGGGLLEVVELLLAVGALVAGVAAQDDEDDPASGGEGGELEGGAVGGGEGEVGGVICYAGGGGKAGEGHGEEEG